MSVIPVYELHGVRVLEFCENHPLIRTAADVTDLIGAALQAQADCVYLPLARLSEAFFQLRSGLAGELAQKFANYRIALAIVGPWHQPGAGGAFQDFVREANGGGALRFAADRSEFEHLLKARRGAPA